MTERPVPCILYEHVPQINVEILDGVEERALAFVEGAHAGQTRWGGGEYLIHLHEAHRTHQLIVGDEPRSQSETDRIPLVTMLQPLHNKAQEKGALTDGGRGALILMHDAGEDQGVTPADLIEQGFSEEIARLFGLLTRPHGEDLHGKVVKSREIAEAEYEPDLQLAKSVDGIANLDVVVVPADKRPKHIGATFRYFDYLAIVTHNNPELPGALKQAFPDSTFAARVDFFFENRPQTSEEVVERAEKWVGLEPQFIDLAGSGEA